MTESLLSRVGRIVSGSINQLVAAAENAAPETVMAEAIREIEQAIADVRDEYGKVKARKHNASQRLAGERARLEELGDRIRLALQQGREDLAEAAASSQLDIEAQLPVLEQTIAECSRRETELEHYSLALKGRQREMEAELQHIRTTLAQAQGTGASGVAGSQDSAVERTVERAAAAFDRAAHSVTGVPGAAAAGDSARLAELEEMARKNRVKERLEQYKRADS